METSCKKLVKENNDWKGDSNSSNQPIQPGGDMMDVRDNRMEDEHQDDPLSITEMPDSIFLHIFSYLPFSSIGNVAQVCQRWWQISNDELLWKEVFLRHYKLPFDMKLPVKARSWRSEFERLYYHTPCLLSEERKEHQDEVLHISFSHDGTMFATCSKDGFFKVWECGQPCRLLFEKDMMSSFSWKFTQFSQFNESDTCLLVSGVYFGTLSTSGEIAVFNLQDDFNMQCRVTNKPYDVFGAWYDNDHLLSGTLYWTGDFNSVSAVWLSKASQEVESEMESVSMVLYRFENKNSSSIRLLHVAEVERAEEDDSDMEKNSWMDHSPSPCQLLPSASVDQGECNLPSSLSSTFMSTFMDAYAGRGINVANGYPERASGCDPSMLDKLLKKNIAENEFDLENEDDTDYEENGGENDDEMNLTRKNNCHHNNTNRQNEEDGFNAKGQDNFVCDSVCVWPNSDHQDHFSDLVENFTENGKEKLDDSATDGGSFNSNSNLNPFRESPPSFSSVGSNYGNWQTGSSSSSQSFSCEQAHSDHFRDTLKCLEEFDKVSDSVKFQNSKCGVDQSSSDRSTNSSDRSTNSSDRSTNSSDGGESAGNCSCSSSSRELSGGFGALGINNSNLVSQLCDCDDCPMEDDEHEISMLNFDNDTASNAQFTLPSPSKFCSFCDSLDFSGDKENKICQKCGGEMTMCQGHRDVISYPNSSHGESIKNLSDRDKKSDGNRLPDSCKDICDSLYVNNSGVGPANCHGVIHKKPLNSDNVRIFDESLSDQRGLVNDSDISCDITPYNKIYANSSNRDISIIDNDNNGQGKFPDDETVCNLPPHSLVAEEGEMEKSTISTYSTNKTMDNAATQTETNCGSLNSSIHSSMAHMTHSMSHSSSLSREAAPRRATDKLLIYTWGSETYIPHKIGIKRIKRSDFCKGEVKARQSSMLLPDVMENLQNLSEDRRDLPDVSIDMHGHIVGLSLSPDDRYLYVNCRAWPQNYIISDPQISPPLAQEVEIFTIDLRTFQFVGPVLRSHKAYTHSDECFFLNLDVSDDYVVSGAEDRKGYIWDRHYGICLGQFEHRNVVNCMAICPSDPEVAVSVSDDNTFKVWMSRRRLKQVETKGMSSSNSLDT